MLDRAMPIISWSRPPGDCRSTAAAPTPPAQGAQTTNINEWTPPCHPRIASGKEAKEEARARARAGEQPATPLVAKFARPAPAARPRFARGLGPGVEPRSRHASLGCGFRTLPPGEPKSRQSALRRAGRACSRGEPQPTAAAPNTHPSGTAPPPGSVGIAQAELSCVGDRGGPPPSSVCTAFHRRLRDRPKEHQKSRLSPTTAMPHRRKWH